MTGRGVIDLTSVGRSDGIPTWKNALPDIHDNHLYSYNSCHRFSHSSCRDVAACQTYATDENLVYSLGTQNSLQWHFFADQPLPTLTYTSGERTLHVNLICISDGQLDNLQVYGYEGFTNSYIMVLSSKCACWNGCKG